MSDIETMSDAERFAARSPASSDGAVDADGDGAPLDFTERLSLAEMRSKFTLEDRFVQLDGMVDKAQRDLSRGYFVPPSQLQTQAERLQEALNTFAMRVTRESPKEAFERAEAVIVGEKGAESDMKEAIAALDQAMEVTLQAQAEADSLAFRFPNAAATTLCTDLLTQRELMCNMYKRFLKSVQDSHRIGKLRYKLRVASPGDYCAYIPALGSSQTLRQYTKVLRMSVSALEGLARDARQLETTVAYDGYRTESAQAAACLSDLAELSHALARSRLQAMTALSDKYATAFKEKLAQAKKQVEAMAREDSLAALDVAVKNNAPNEDDATAAKATAAATAATATTSGPRRWASAMARTVEGDSWLTREKGRIKEELRQAFASDWQLAQLHESSQFDADMGRLASLAAAARLVPPKAKSMASVKNMLASERSALRRRTQREEGVDGALDDTGTTARADLLVALASMVEDYVQLKERVKVQRGMQRRASTRR